MNLKFWKYRDAADQQDRLPGEPGISQKVASALDDYFGDSEQGAWKVSRPLPEARIQGTDHTKDASHVQREISENSPRAASWLKDRFGFSTGKKIQGSSPENPSTKLEPISK